MRAGTCIENFIRVMSSLCTYVDNYSLTKNSPSKMLSREVADGGIKVHEKVSTLRDQNTFTLSLLPTQHHVLYYIHGGGIQ